MPIHINLLAEAKALEELRRRDPVKRAVLVAVFLVIVTLTASCLLQLQVLVRKAALSHVESQLSTRTNEFQQILANQRHLVDVTHKLGALEQMATNRLLFGTMLNAFQQTTIDEVQLLRMRTEQNYLLTEEIKPRTNSDERIIPGRPATSTERILLTIDARDSSANPGDQVNKFKQAIAECPYFQNLLGKTNEVRLTSLSPPQALEGKPCVQFTLECRFPERTR
jgi:hypothetical protein